MRSYRTLGLLIVLTLLGAEAAQAASYSLLPVAAFGDTAGGVRISSDPEARFEVGTLNDSAQLTFVAGNTAGGELLAVYAGGAWVPLVAAGKNGPTGPWPKDVQILSPASLNPQGNIAFTINSFAAGFPSDLTFLWDASTGLFTQLALNGLPNVFLLTWDRGGDWVTSMNKSNEVTFVTDLEDPQGIGREAVFFRRRDGQLVPVTRPDDRLEDGSVINDATDPIVNDDGVIAYTARRVGDPIDAGSAFRWELGSHTRIAVVGTALPDGHKVANVVHAWVNNANRKILLALNADKFEPINQVASPISLYLWDNGVFSAVAVPGQTMPDGSKLLGVQDFGVSAANGLGQHAFLATLDGGATGAYLMDANGNLSLILKSGDATNLGTVRNVGQGAGTSSGIALNGAGQVALTAQLGSNPDAIYLLTPSTP